MLPQVPDYWCPPLIALVVGAGARLRPARAAVMTWLLLVREPAAAQLPTYGLGLLSCLPPALTLAESDTVAKPTALS